MGLGWRTDFDASRELDPAFTFRFVFVLLFRFTAPLSQRIPKASKTSLLSNR